MYKIFLPLARKAGIALACRLASVLTLATFSTHSVRSSSPSSYANSHKNISYVSTKKTDRNASQIKSMQPKLTNFL